MDEIHFNNGLHGWHLSAEEYGEALEGVLRYLLLIKPENAKLVVATTTQSRRSKEENDQVILRNEKAVQIAEKLGLPVDHLYETSVACTEHMASDNIHYLEKGYEIMGKQVADYMLAL